MKSQSSRATGTEVTERTLKPAPDQRPKDEASLAARSNGQGLEVVGVTKVFRSNRGRAVALEDVSLHVARGQFVTLIGPTGCGKSTLLRIVAGLLGADSGSVSIFGEPPERATAAKHIGFVPQSPALMPWRTVLNNVRMPFQVNKKANHGRTAQFRDPAEVLETFGLGTALNSRPAELSGGMQQRVAIARAFVFDPAILLMDEPFSALDELTRERQRHHLLDIWQADRKTVLFVTHSVPEAVFLSDEVIVMSGQPGRIHSVVPVGLPRPRRDLVETTEEFHEVERRIRTELREAWREREA